MNPHEDVKEFEARRFQKKKQRNHHWQERQERSKVSRDEIEGLRERRDELRQKLDAREKSADEANLITDDDIKLRHFNQLPISQRTLMGLERGNYRKMTPIQSDTLHLALAGCDVLGAAKTGSGKTLCFVVPVLERLFVEHWDSDMGVGAIVLSPTRELALQIFRVMQLVGYKHVLSAALLTGGRDVMEERKRLHVISIIVGTPGRVLHHLEDDAELVMDNLQILCMDEADRLLDLGFREAINNILRYLPPQRQTLLFSATQTTDVQMLAQLALKNPRYVTAHAITAAPTPSSLSQNFLVVEIGRKLDALLMFLKRHPNDKIVVFVSTCNQVKYMYQAFSRILKKMRIPSMCLTSKMKQFRREEVFLTFCRCKSAVLFCTDIAARGLDFPLVHWVVQYDCPDSAQTYIHRAGRTARAGARGVNLLFLTPRETPMLSYLANKNLQLREIAIKPSMMHVSQEIFVALVVQGLKYEAQKAFISYLRSVYFASNKHVFEVASIDVDAFAKSLGLLVVPDMTELRNLQRSAKNLPWDVVNYIARTGGAKAEDKATSGASLTRKEKHLKASDMFRMLEQRQKFAPKNANDSSDDDDDDDGDTFLVKKKKPTGTGEPGDAEAEAAAEEASRRLTLDERLAGLSKAKKRKYIENADLRVRDLGLSERIVFAEDEDGDGTNTRRDTQDAGSDAEDEEEARAFHLRMLQNAVVNSESDNDSDSDDDDEGGDGRRAKDEEDDEEEDQDAFARRLRKRVHSAREDDRDRSRKLRRLRRLQKEGRAPKKASLQDDEAHHQGKSKRARHENGGEDGEDSDEDEDQGVRLATHSSDSDNDDAGEQSDEYADDISSDGSLADLLRTVAPAGEEGGAYRGIDEDSDSD